MQIIIHVPGFSLTDALENHVRTRIGFAFSRASSRVRRIHVTLSDLNGPRGGVDKRCLIEVQLDGLAAVVVEDVQLKMYTAIDRAAGRAARTVMRRLALGSSRRRQQAHQHAQRFSIGL